MLEVVLGVKSLVSDETYTSCLLVPRGHDEHG